MELLSFKLPSSLRRRLAEEAQRRRVSQAAVIRECLEGTLPGSGAPGRKGICAELAGDLVGSFRGPADLAVNDRYLAEAIVTDDRSAKKRRR